MKVHRLIAVTALALLLFASLSEGKRPGRRRHKVARRPPRGRGPRGRGPTAQESQRVYFYSVPRTTVRPRIILGSELNFKELGFPGAVEQQQPQPSPSQHHGSLSNLEQDLFDDGPYQPAPPPARYPPNHPPPHPKRGPKKHPRSRGPGYRRPEGRPPWQGYHVIEDDYKPHKPKPGGGYAVMPYLRNAGKNLAGAYRAAIIQSAKVAKFTGHAASKYIKGVANLLGSTAGDPHADRADSQKTKGQSRDSLVIPTSNKLEETTAPSEPEIIDLELLDDKSEDAEGLLPKVYLDWGGSFWRFFYNKSKEMHPPEEENKKS